MNARNVVALVNPNVLTALRALNVDIAKELGRNVGQTDVDTIISNAIGALVYACTRSEDKASLGLRIAADMLELCASEMRDCAAREAADVAARAHLLAPVVPVFDIVNTSIMTLQAVAEGDSGECYNASLDDVKAVVDAFLGLTDGEPGARTRDRWVAYYGRAMALRCDRIGNGGRKPEGV